VISAYLPTVPIVAGILVFILLARYGGVGRGWWPPRGPFSDWDPHSPRG